LRTAVSSAMSVLHFSSLPAATDGLTGTGCTERHFRWTRAAPFDYRFS